MPNVPEHITLDFETEAIARRPQYPPKPVGFSIMDPGERRSKYWAWGHPTRNNCTREQAYQRLRAAWCSGYDILCHHGKFDIDVAETHMGMPRLQAERIQDTLYLLFLHDPHALSLSLKPAADKILGMKPDERDALFEWQVANIPAVKRKPSAAGAYICAAPGDIVGRYADGDVIRTHRLFEDLYPEIRKRNMLGAYVREQQLMPIMLDSEREGIRVALGTPPKKFDGVLKLNGTLENDYIVYLQAMETADHWLRKQLKNKELNLDSDDEVAEALASSGIVNDWVLTKTGKRSTSKKNMTIDKFSNQRIAQVYGYRTRLRTCLSTFMEPWLEMARASNGIIFTTWNQVRQAHGNDGSVGTRTGRLSSTPNFQNIPKDFEDNNDGWTHPKWFVGLPQLPLMRRYLLPDRGHVWLKRDYAQQELRILAHFEKGSLLNRYNTDASYDMHADVLAYLTKEAGLQINRSGAKILNFGDIYGMGIGEFARKAKISYQLAQRAKRAKHAMLPDFHKLDEDIKLAGRSGYPIRTWGGREYYCEEGHFVEKFRRHMTFEYKLLNYLIQGSAADCTKEAVIRYHWHPKRQARFLLTVHDEVNSSSPKARWKEEMAVMRECMEGIEFDTTMYSDGEYGPNWGTLSDVKESRELTPPEPNPMHTWSFGYAGGQKALEKLKDENEQRDRKKKEAVLAKLAGRRAANYVLAEQGLQVGRKGRISVVLRKAVNA